MSTGARFRGGSFARNATARQALRNAPTGGVSASDVLDAYERAEWKQEQTEAIVGGVQQESIVPYWLEPVGETGLYVTPNEPVDPWDCDRWADSPYCGGTGVDPLDIAQLQPAAATPIFSTNSDLSEFCVEVGMNVFGLALPSYSACYRAPWARPPEQIPPPSRMPATAQWHTFDFGGELPGGLECDYWVGIDLFLYDGVHKTEGLVTGVPIGWYIVDIPYPQAAYFPSVIKQELVIVTQTTAEYSGFPGYVRYYGFYGYPYSYAITSVSLPNGSVRLDSCPTRNPTPYTRPPTYKSPPNLPSEPMSCCNTAEIEEMLRLLMKRVGTDQYPATVPKNIADKGKETEQIQTLTELVAWTVKQLDALMGQFPIEIEIKDVDPTQEGNQSRKVSLPNLAEYASEMYGLALRSAVNSDVHTNFLMRLAAEIVATKNATIVTQDYARANASYLGYKANTVKRTIDYAFDVTKLDNLEGILNNCQKHLVGWQDDDENTVQAYLERLMFAASIIKQVYFRPSAQVDGLAKELQNLLGANGSENQPEQQRTEEQWRAFLQEINSPTGGFNRNSPIIPRVSDPTVSGEASPDVTTTGFDLISDVSNPDPATG